MHPRSPPPRSSPLVDLIPLSLARRRTGRAQLSRALPTERLGSRTYRSPPLAAVELPRGSRALGVVAARSQQLALSASAYPHKPASTSSLRLFGRSRPPERAARLSVVRLVLVESSSPRLDIRSVCASSCANSSPSPSHDIGAASRDGTSPQLASSSPFARCASPPLFSLPSSARTGS